MSFANKNDLPDYSVFGESPLGSCHRGGTFGCILAHCANSGIENRGFSSAFDRIEFTLYDDVEAPNTIGT